MRSRETAPERGDGGDSRGGNRQRDRDRQRERWGFRAGETGGEMRQRWEEGPNKAGREAVLRGLEGVVGGQGCSRRVRHANRRERDNAIKRVWPNNQREKLCPEKG